MLGAGCIFSPKKDNPTDGGGGGTVYPKLDDPTHVLSALILAYQNRDSVEYKTLYDSSYVGTSTDLNDPPGTQVSTFRYADEVMHIAALQRTTTISSVVFDLGSPLSWNRLSSDDLSHPEYAQIQISSWHVDIFDGATEYFVQSSNPTTFTFKPTVVAVADTTWKIVKWVEVGSTSGGI